MNFPLTTAVSVIEHRTFRFVAGQLGWHLRREGDNIIVFPHVAGSPMYMSKDAEQLHGIVPLGTLYVDEGYFDGTLYASCKGTMPHEFTVRSSYSFDEVVDGTSVFRMLASTLAPNATYEKNPFIGQGRAQRFMQAQYCRVLSRKTAGDLVFVTPADEM